jgi:hypothetical protein
MGSKGSSGKTQSTTTTSAPPEYIASAYKDILNKAKGVYDLPLQQFGGPQLAGFTPDQEAAFSTIRNAGGIWQPYIDTASNLATQGTQDIWGELPQWGADTLSQYYNPYEDQVVNQTIDDIRRSNALQQQDLIGNAIASGAWGGSGADDARSNLAYEQGQSSAGILAGLRSQGYESAANKFLTEKAAQQNALATTRGLNLQGSGIMAGLGNQALTSTLGQAGAQMDAGTQQQNLVQQQLNIPYEQFLQQQAFPYEQLQYYANIAAALGGGAGGTTTGTGKAPGQGSSGVGNALGTAATIASLFASDRNVKKDVKKIGILDNNLPVYSFKYKGDDATQIGLMAQDVEKKNPDAVHNIGGIKHVDYSQAMKRDGGRVTGPAIMNKTRAGGIIPTDGFASARLGAPSPTPLPGVNSSGGGMSGFGNLAGLFGGKDGLDFGNMMFATGQGASPGQIGRAAMGAFGPGFKHGGKVMDYRMGGRVCYADGGEVQEPDINTIMTGSGTPVAGFKPVVAGTPVYAFNPLAAKAQSVNIPDRIPKPSADDLAAAQKAPASMGFGDFYAALMMDPRKAYQFEGFKTLGTNFAGNDANRQKIVEGIIPHLYGMYQKDPSKYNVTPKFASGGIVGYAPGGMVLPMSVPGTSRQTVLPAALQKNAGISYIPGAELNTASLAAPGAMRLPSTQQPAQEAGAGIVPSISKDMLPDGTIQELPNAAGNTDISGLNLDQRFKRSMEEPWRAALFTGGANMLGYQGDGWGALAQGLQTGASTYAGIKRAEKDAASDAQKLLMEVTKFQKEMDLKDKEIALKERELGTGDFSTVEGDDEVLVLNKQTGELKSTGRKPKNKSSTIDVSPNDVYGIEDLALGMIPGGTTQSGGKTKVNPKVYNLVADRDAALQAASEAYQKTRNANEAAKVYLQMAGIDPTDAKFTDGWFSAPKIKKGEGKKKKETKASADASALLNEAKSAIAKGAPRDKVTARLKSMGVDPGEL